MAIADQNRESGSLVSYRVKMQTVVTVAYPAGPVSFRHREGLPIKLSVNSAALIEVTCGHGRLHRFELDVQPDIEWLIQGELKKSGAFKIGHGGSDEYRAKEAGECVIYYPPPDISTGQEVRTGMLILTSSAGKETRHSVYLTLKRQDGFGKGVSYSAQLQVLPPQDVDAEEAPGPDLDDPCRECNIRIEAEQSSWSAANVSRYMTTSEYVKLAATEERKGEFWLIHGTKKTKVDGLSPAVKTAEWKCTAGSFVGGGEGLSAVYLTPGDNELAKSPVTIEFRQGDKIQAKKVWLLRRQSAMHC
ncbi:hypothetical protein [Nitrososphaera sp.]|uniref:hypothetical protein n=1 Tax=Nitrososphaera sp. TaxID=1971748 RepID=UPI00307ECFA1